jgi:hypothetical protein
MADFAAHLLWLAVLAAFAFLWADTVAPPQDLPWKPLSLADPLGLATRSKLIRAQADPARCLGVLRAGGEHLRETEPRASGFCRVDHGVILTSPQPALVPAAPLLSCREALAYDLWVRDVVEPAAVQELGAAVVRVHHYGSYACRRIYGAAGPAPISQHAYANAFDVAAFDLSDGRSVSVASDWRDTGAAGRFIHRVHDGACRLFNGVLGPGYNAAHANHLHLDMGPYLICR